MLRRNSKLIFNCQNPLRHLTQAGYFSFSDSNFTRYHRRFQLLLVCPSPWLTTSTVQVIHAGLLVFDLGNKWFSCKYAYCSLALFKKTRFKFVVNEMKSDCSYSQQRVPRIFTCLRYHFVAYIYIAIWTIFFQVMYVSCIVLYNGIFNFTLTLSFE